MSRKIALYGSLLGALCMGLVLGCRKKATGPDKPDPKPTKPNVMRPAPDAGMRPVPGPAAKKARAASLLNCDLSAGKSFKAGQPVTMTWKLTNTGKTLVRLLTWQTPLELNSGALTGNAFRVLRDGKPVPYKGAQVKRNSPAAKDYVSLAPGKTLVASLDLSKSYDLSKAGKYSVSVARPMLDMVVDVKVKLPRKTDAHQPAKPTTNTITFAVIAGK